MDAGNANVGAGAGDANQRQRFHVELKPGQTNIVSLKKLRREAGEAVSDDSSDENEAEKYIRVELPRNKKSGALAIRDKVQHKTGRIEYSKSSNDQTIKKRKELMDSVGEEDDIQVGTRPKKKGKQFIKTAAETAIFINGNSKSQELNIQNDRCKGDFQTPLDSSGGVILKKHSAASSKLIPGNNISFTSAAHQKFLGEKSTQHELHSRSSMNKNIEQEGFANIKQQSKKRRNDLPDLNLPYSGHAPRTTSVPMTDEPKSGTTSVPMTDEPKSGKKMLYRSIMQLEKLVENSNTPLIDVQGADASLLDIENQMSPDLKEKLAKVARLAQLNYGHISDELIDRLMGILGKYLQRKTLKKILRATVLEDLYVSKAECKNFKRIKMDIVKVFPAEITKGTYSMGDQLEDKLYDLYDTFTQGLDEDIGPSLVRKLYAKLADLWPKGTMDIHEIRKAICRAKERKMELSSEEEKGHQTTKKRKLSARTGETIRGKACSIFQKPAAYGNVTTDTSRLTQTSANRRMVSSMLTVDLPFTAPSSMSIPSKKLYRNLV